MDSTNCVMCIPKTTNVKAILTEQFDVKESKSPNLDYSYPSLPKDKESSANYSGYFLKIALELSKHYESIRFFLKADYPLKIECDDLIFIIAPRIENE